MTELKGIVFFLVANSSESAVVEDIITLVKGGVTETGSGLLAIRNQETYRKWGASLKYNPALIDFEVTLNNFKSCSPTCFYTYNQIYIPDSRFCRFMRASASAQQLTMQARE